MSKLVPPNGLGRLVMIRDNGTCIHGYNQYLSCISYIIFQYLSRFVTGVTFRFINTFFFHCNLLGTISRDKAIYGLSNTTRSPDNFTSI